ncbi:protein FAM200C-like [Palaemon carinicauda]|uniref:protein FAM200C-like n=1 Tax=Palaemon carinicauda TaxID=392227 RepID=UPI0035B5F3F2
MSGDIKEQVVAAIKESRKCSMQLDESTDVSDFGQILVYVRYQGKSDIEENFLFCKQLETTTTGEDLFKLVDSFIKEKGLRWDQCSSVCSDGAPAMLGAHQGFTASVKQVKATVIVTYYEENASLLDVQSVIVGHLEKLSEEFHRYIPDGELHDKYRWVCRPFDVHAENVSEEESFIQNLQEERNETLHFNFQQQSLAVFWTAVKKKKSVLGESLTNTTLLYGKLTTVISAVFSFDSVKPSKITCTELS